MSNNGHMLCFSVGQRLDDDGSVIGVYVSVFYRDFNPLADESEVPEIITRAHALATNLKEEPRLSEIIAALGQDNALVINLLFKVVSECGKPEGITKVIWSDQHGYIFQFLFSNKE